MIATMRLAARSLLFMCAAEPAKQIVPISGGPIVRGTAKELWPSADLEPQDALRWGVDGALAASVCNMRDGGAEPNMFFTERLEFTRQLNWQRGVL